MSFKLKIIYLDNSATTKPYAEVVSAMSECMTFFYGNPSSLHRLGFEAEKAVKKARESVAKRLAVAPETVYFTSGGTESNNTAIFGAYRSGKVITTPIEHKSVLEPMKRLGCAEFASVNKDGTVSLESLESLIDKDTTLVSVMHVNNETGAVQPISEIKKIIKEKAPRALFHVDAVQSFCKIPIPENTADLISVSAHKIHGPKGVGALYVRRGIRLNPHILGGGQEKGVRSGTENVPGIVGFGKACEKVNDFSHVEKLGAILRERLENIKINGCGMPYILNVAYPGIRSEIIVHALEAKGVMVSSGSACSSSKASYVLEAMGLPKGYPDSSIRISLSAENTEDEIITATDIINETIRDLKRQLRIKD